MNDRLTAEVQRDKHRFHVFSPLVGVVRLSVSDKTVLQPGSLCGQFRQLNRVYDLVIPPDVYGRVVMDDRDDVEWAVGFNDALFSLDPEISGLEVAEEVQAKRTSRSRREDGCVVTAFTTGIFYRKPSPEEPPFIEAGDRVEKGSVLGLIEVMKSFNQVLFSGSDQWQGGIIKEVLVEDAQEVKEGDPLFVVGKEGGK